MKIFSSLELRASMFFVDVEKLRERHLNLFRSCINEICYVSFPQCPLCALPISACEITPASFLNQLFQLGLKLQECLKKLEGSNIEGHKLEDLFKPDVQTRTIEEFCATQKEVSTDNEIDNDCYKEHDNDEHLEPVAENTTKSTLKQTGWDVAGTTAGSSSTLQPKNVASPNVGGRGLKRKIDSPSMYEVGEFPVQAPIPDGFLFSQESTQTMPMPQMTQQFPIFEEPSTLCFFQQKPKKTFADRIMSKPKTPNSGGRKRKTRLEKTRPESPEVF